MNRFTIVLAGLGLLIPAPSRAGCAADARPAEQPVRRVVTVAPPAPSAEAWPFDAEEAKRRQREAAARLDVLVKASVDLGDDVKMDFVLIPPGEFVMGSPAGEEKRSPREGPRHPVRITKPFYLGVTEVTRAQWVNVTGKKPYTVKGPDRPIGVVSWDEAMDFCERLTERERAAGRLSDREQYRLPTEAEWEYACRAGMATMYSFGDDRNRLSEYAWFGESNAPPVAQKKPNPWGLYDMHGNVWEWVLDCYDDAPYPPGLRIDPVGAPSGEKRLFRGGSWCNSWWHLRSAYRGRRLGSYRCHVVGFRCVRAAVVAVRPPEKYPANLAPIDVENAFTKANPEYKWRAGAFYEKEYLGRAVENLAKAAGLNNNERTAAKAILRAFIYDWLDSYVRGNGTIAEPDLKKHLALMDERFRGELTEVKHKKYLHWRTDTTRARNPLAFLMRVSDGTRALGPDAGKPRSIPDLLAALAAATKRGRGYVPIRRELARIGAPVVESLVAVIADDDSPIQDAAGWTLYRIRDAEAVPLLIRHLKHPHALVRKWCANTFAAMGEPRAVEPLLAALDDEHWEVRKSAAWALGHIKEAVPKALNPLLQMLRGDPRWEVRLSAAGALGRLAPADPAVHAALEAAAENPDQHPAVRKIADKYARAGYNALMSDLSSPDPVKRAVAARALGRMKTVEAIPALIAMLGDPAVAQVAPKERIIPREAAVDALVMIGEPAVGPLIEALASKNSLVQQNAMRALGRIRDPRAIPVLILGLEDREDRNRQAAAEGLVSIGRPVVRPLAMEFQTYKFRYGDFRSEATNVIVRIGEPAIGPLANVFRGGNQKVRIFTGQVLADIGKAAVPTLIDLLNDNDPEARHWAGYYLAQLKDPRSVESLAKALSTDDHPSVRSVAARALGRIKDERAIEPLMAALSDDDWNVRADSAVALGGMKVHGALEPIMGMLKDRRYQVRRKALVAVGAMEDTRAVEPIIPLLKDERSRVREAAADALGRLRDPRGVEPLLEALEDPSRFVRCQAAGALGQVGDARAVEALIRCSRSDTESVVRCRAISALSQIGDRRAVIPLIALLKSDNELVRRESAKALGGLHDSAAVEALIAALWDEWFPVREEAAKSLACLTDQSFGIDPPRWLRWWEKRGSNRR